MNAAVRDSDTLFGQAIEIASPEERALFLQKACADDPELWSELEKLVRYHFRAGSFLESPATQVVANHDGLAAESPDMMLGAYQLVEKIGEGSFGVVFLAEQTQPVRRKVAVKILKPGMDTRQVVARFEAERQALALMDHPNIAHVFHGGATASGRPYFVMELVRGIPITDFCDENRLPVRARMELFVTVCQAIQHAHQKGIIHRDIKPSNVLVTLKDGKPVVKVIDFGVAKALGQKLTEKSLVSSYAQMIGTPLYMSPEQAELGGRDVDTRADIYEMGVLLYELLTGTTPVEKERLRTVGFDELRRIIGEEEPPRPSSRLSTLGQAATTVCTQRQSDSKQLSRLFRGELDWIVMKCLEKDRDRRYETASALAADVRCYLADEPVLARPPSLRYRLGKFLRKYRGPVLAASVILALLVGGIIGTSLGFARAERLRRIAQGSEQAAQREKTNALASAAAEHLAQQNEAAQQKKAETAQMQAWEVLHATTDDVMEQLIGARPVLGPAERAYVENTLKRWLTFAAEYEDGAVARQIRARGVFRVAYLRVFLGEYDAAVAGYREASVLWDKLATDFPAVPRFRKEVAASQHNLGNLLRNLGQLADAEAAYRRALSIQEKLAADVPDEPKYRQDLALCHNNLGTLLLDQRKRPEAEAACRLAVTIQEKLATDFPAEPEYRQNLADSHNNLGLVLRDQSKRPEAEAAFRQEMAIQEELVDDFPAVPKYLQGLATSYSNLGLLLRDLDKRPEAEAACRQALTIREKLAADFPAVPQYRHELAASHNYLGKLLRDQGKRPEAEAAYRRALVIREKLAADLPAIPQYRQDLAVNLDNLGALLDDLGRWDEAETAYRQVLSIEEKLAAEFSDQPTYRICLGGGQVNLSRVLRKNLQPEPALELTTQAIATLEGVLQQVKVDAVARRFLRNAYLVRAETLDLDLKRHAEAVADWDKSVELSPGPEQLVLRMKRAACRARAGQMDAAIHEAEQLVKNANAGMLLNAACVFALAAARPDETAGPLPKEECAKRAVALLRQAIAKDVKIAEQIERNDDLKALRDREDFKKLLAELHKKSP
jgi:serine/threonine protein kinase